MSPEEPARDEHGAVAVDALAVADAEREERRLLAFYDRLRARMEKSMSRRVGDGASQAVLAAPDLFVLLVRLFMDRGVPESTRALVGGALAYFLLPADLMPEVLLGFGGFLDDVVITAAVVSHVLSRDLEPVVEQHWSGSQRLREVLADVARASDVLLSYRLQDRLARVLARYGIQLRSEGRSG
jgi:uncharacterized membrane protein YkvA (DUF1232 family)